MIIWIWGRPCVGKSTLAEALYKELRKRNWSVRWIDSEKVRIKSGRIESNFTFEERCKYMDKLRFMAQMYSKCNEFVIVSAITPYKGMRYRNRKAFGNNLLEIYMKASIQSCKERDKKNIYEKALSGEIKNFTGISDKFDKGETFDIMCDTDSKTFQENLNKILKHLNYL